MRNSSIAPPLEVALEIGRAVEEVQAVFLAFAETEKLLTVLTILPERDRSICRRVYAIEQHIIDRYPEFDFAFSFSRTTVESHARSSRTSVTPAHSPTCRCVRRSANAPFPADHCAPWR
jgi:hypothetical protein